MADKDGSLVYLVQRWRNKRNLNFDNDDVEIVGVFQQYESAKDFLNQRFTEALASSESDLYQTIFPDSAFSLREQLKEIASASLGVYLGMDLVDYLYKYTQFDIMRGLTVGLPIEGKEYEGQLILIDFDQGNLIHQLLSLHQWFCNKTPGAYFHELSADVPLLINQEFPAVLKKMSTDSYRLYLKNKDGVSEESIYVTENLVDFENCRFRERHFCHCYRIFSRKLLE